MSSENKSYFISGEYFQTERLVGQVYPTKEEADKDAPKRRARRLQPNNAVPVFKAAGSAK